MIWIDTTSVKTGRSTLAGLIFVMAAMINGEAVWDVGYEKLVTSSMGTLCYAINTYFAVTVVI